MKSTRGRLAIATFVAFANLILSAAAYSSGTKLRLVSNLDNARSLPHENVVYISQETTKLTLQLETFSRRKYVDFPNTVVSVIDEAGNKREFRADDDGQVTITDIGEGLYGVAAFSDHAHGSTVFAVRHSEQDNHSLLDDVMDFDRKPATAKLVMALAIGRKLAPLIHGQLIDDRDVPAVAVDRNVVEYKNTRQPHDYRVQLGKGGVLRGQLITVMRTSSRHSAVKGTRITVTKNGLPVAHVDANALGMFQIGGLRPGTHGLVVAGRGGYAAFAFEAFDAQSVAEANQPADRLVAWRAQFDGTILPVALIPPTMIPAVLESVNDHISEIHGLPAPAPLQPRSPIPPIPPRSVDPIPAPAQQPVADPAPPVLEIADGNISFGDIAMVDIDPNCTCGSIGDTTPHNWLRYSGGHGITGGTAGAVGGGGSGGGSTGLPALIGLGAAIAVPIAASSGNSSPGIPISNSGI